MQHFQNILVFVDGDAPHSFAFQSALQLAGMSGAALKVVGVLEPLPWYSQAVLSESHGQQFQELLERDLNEQLAKLKSQAQDLGVGVETKLLRGRGAIEIIREVHKFNHDLVIADAEQKADGEAQVSAFGMRLLRKCPVPVWLVKTPPSEKFDRILAAVNPSAEANEERQALNLSIIHLAGSLARIEHAQLDVVRAWSVYGERVLRSNMSEEDFEDCLASTEHTVRTTLEKFLDESGEPIPSDRVHLIKGDPETVIPRFVHDERIDLVVMGTVARSGVVGLVIGNTAESILSRIGCSVLAVKPTGFVSQIPPEA